MKSTHSIKTKNAKICKFTKIKNVYFFIKSYEMNIRATLNFFSVNLYLLFDLSKQTANGQSLFDN